MSEIKDKDLEKAVGGYSYTGPRHVNASDPACGSYDPKVFAADDLPDHMPARDTCGSCYYFSDRNGTCMSTM